MIPAHAWPGGARCAVSLTYDDALPVHRERVAPALEAAGLRGTFYVPVNADLRRHHAAWSAVAARGHELGNHSCFHPCTRTPERAGWLDAQADLGRYTAAGLERELEVANFVLERIDGRGRRSYGNTCHEEHFGPDRSPMRPILERQFAAARGRHTGVPSTGAIDLFSIGCTGGDGRDARALIDLVEGAVASGGWLVLCFHGLGAGTHGIFVDPDAHAALLAHLAARRGSIHVAPVVDVAGAVAGVAA